MTDFPIVDSHVHFFNKELLNYSWTESVPLLKPNFAPTEYLQQNGNAKVESIIVVEAAADNVPGLDVREAQWFSSLAEAHPIIAAIVAPLALETGDQCEETLKMLKTNLLLCLQ